MLSASDLNTIADLCRHIIDKRLSDREVPCNCTDKIANLERVVEMLKGHKHTADGCISVCIYDAEQAVWSSQHYEEMKTDMKKGESDAKPK